MGTLLRGKGTSEKEELGYSFLVTLSLLWSAE
jgi:hypothetical protein